MELNGVTIKIGDRVKVIASDSTKSVFGIVEPMLPLVGYVGKIVSLEDPKNGIRLKHPHGMHAWTWHIDDVELHKSVEGE